MNTALTWFIRIWCGLAILFNVVSIGIVVARSPTLWDALSYIWAIFSPYNVKNYALEVLLFSPAIAAEVWRQRRVARQRGL